MYNIAMGRSQLNQDDFDFLLTNASVGKSLGLTHFAHLDQPICIWNYIRIADDIAQQIPTGHILDWGCGLGQMTYLLKRRGFQITAFDIGETGKTTLPEIPLCHALNVIYSTHPTNLPFLEKTFDAVLSCGVLEHIDELSQPGNEIKSLHEIARVLRPDGNFLIYQLPQLYGWPEAIVRCFKLAYTHPRRYTATEITRILEQTGFSVQRIRRTNLIPKNLTGIPNNLRIAYSLFSKILITLDGILCKIPGLNYIAGGLEVIAQYKGT
jgi:2-polyprenyl-3-methyl-5-hydroxy-6-metoxy-1,4-benzoquinol methylase